VTPLEEAAVTVVALTLVLLFIHGLAWIGAVRRRWNDQAFMTGSIAFGVYFLPSAWIFGLPGFVTLTSLLALGLYVAVFHRALYTGGVVVVDRYHRSRNAIHAARLRGQQRIEAARRQAETARQQRLYTKHESTYRGRIQSVLAAERRLIEAFRQFGVEMAPGAEQQCRAIVVASLGGGRDAGAELAQLEKQVQSELQALEQAQADYRRTCALLEEAKTAVLQNRSTTLLGDLDAISARLGREVVADIFANRRWDVAGEAFRIMSERLVMLRDTARGRPRPEPPPQKPAPPQPRRLVTLEDAYAVLGVDAEWSKESIRLTRNALLKRYQVDGIKDPIKWKWSSDKMQEVNDAWAIVDRLRPGN
jgi:hypothetical protein